MTESLWLSKTEFAYRRIRAAIEEGRHRPSDKLSINQLSEELAISPTPVREALRMLQAHGLVTHEPHLGMVVASYSKEQAAEVIDLRLLLEPHAVERAMPRISDDVIERMQFLHDQMVNALEDGDHDVNLANLNTEFHKTLYDAAGSELLRASIDDLWARVPLQVMWFEGRAEESVRQHGELLEAVRHGDAEGAAQLTRDHILWGAASTPAHVKAIWDPGVSS